MSFLMIVGAWLVAFVTMWLSVFTTALAWPSLGEFHLLLLLAILHGWPTLVVGWPVYLTIFRRLSLLRQPVPRFWWYPAIGVCLFPVPLVLSYVGRGVYVGEFSRLGDIFRDYIVVILHSLIFGVVLGLIFSAREYLRSHRYR